MIRDKELAVIAALQEHLSRTYPQIHLAFLQHEFLDEADALLSLPIPLIDSRQLASLPRAFILTIGGDGTVLKAAQASVHTGIPIIGVNVGVVGFLADLELPSFHKALDQILAGNFKLERRSSLQVLHKNTSGEIQEYEAINEVVLSMRAHIVNYYLKVDGKHSFQMRADGIIVSTSTGSTAYALSNNGPFIDPSIDTLELVQISPHNISIRPLILSPKAKLELRLDYREQAHAGSPVLLLDGNMKASIAIGDTILLGLRTEAWQMLHLPDYHYLLNCQRKLGFNYKYKRYSREKKE